MTKINEPAYIRRPGATIIENASEDVCATVIHNVEFCYDLFSIGRPRISLALLEQFGQVIVISRGKVAVYVCEIAASTRPIYMTKNEYGVLVE